MTDRFAFLHFTKAGGTSVRRALKGALSPERMVVGMDRSGFGNFDAFDGLRQATRREILLHSDDYNTAADLVHGHFAFSTLRSRLICHCGCINAA